MFDVHLYAVVRRKVPNIPADSLQAAITAAQSHPSTARWLQRLDDPVGGGEFAEEFSHYLVDIVGDAEFEQSCWFHAAETPLLQILRRLVCWDETGRTPEGMRALLHNVRQILSQTV